MNDEGLRLVVDSENPRPRLAGGRPKLILAALGLALAAPLLAHIFFTSRYQTNDDAYMTMVSCGAGV